MADEQDEDAMFDRLAKGLHAVRQDAELVRSSGAEGMTARLARAETELRNLAAAVESLRHGTDTQRAAMQRLEAAAAKSETDLQGLRQTVEALSRRLVEQTETFARSSARKRPSRRPATRVGLVLIVLMLAMAGGAAGWIAYGREPTPSALAHRVVARLSELSGIDLAAFIEPARSVRTGPQATPNPDPAPQLQASAAPPSAAPAAAAPASAAPVSMAAAAADRPRAAVAASAATLSFAPPRPADTPAAIMSPPTEMLATAAPSPAQTVAAAVPPPVVTPAPVAAPPIAQSAPQVPPAPALAQPSQPPQAARHLMLRATTDAWVQVRQKGGRVLLSRTLKAGDAWPVPADPDLILDAGNVEGLDLEVDGVPTRLTGATGGVIHNVALDADLLRSGVVVRAAH